METKRLANPRARSHPSLILCISLSLQEISNAYEVLSDDQKRSIYDRFGEAGLKGGAGGCGGGGMGGAGQGDFTNPFDIFEQFFGGGMGGGGGDGWGHGRPAPPSGPRPGHG